MLRAGISVSTTRPETKIMNSSDVIKSNMSCFLFSVSFKIALS